VAKKISENLQHFFIIRYQKHSICLCVSGNHRFTIRWIPFNLAETRKSKGRQALPFNKEPIGCYLLPNTVLCLSQ